MRAMIEQTIEIIDGVCRKWASRRSGESLEDLRVEVAHHIADHRGIAYQSVIDKPGRKFAPDITSLPQFDDLLEQFLVSRSGKLQALLLKHAQSEDERCAIRAALGGSPGHGVTRPNPQTHEPHHHADPTPPQDPRQDDPVSIRVHNRKSDRSVIFRRGFGRDLDDAVSRYGKETVFGLFRAMSVIRCQAAVRSALASKSISDAAAIEVGMTFDPNEGRRNRRRPDPVALLAAKVGRGEISMDEVRELLEAEVNRLSGDRD
jgi:hypothetical protein